MKSIERPSEVKSPSLLKAIILRFVLAFLALGAMFFLSAGTVYYWEAWLYLFTLMIPAAFLVRYLYKSDPKLLERRMRMRETQKTQKLIQKLSWPFFLLAFIIPGLDVRFHWSNVPYYVIIIADVLVLLGYLIIALVFRTNTYASRIIEVEKGQKVISTGPYSIVRHPMYSGVMIFYTFSPLALGSYWTMILALLIIPLLVFRIRGEEQELLANLEGYKEYVMKTKYRLIPGIY